MATGFRSPVRKSRPGIVGRNTAVALAGNIGHISNPKVYSGTARKANSYRQCHRARAAPEVSDSALDGVVFVVGAGHGDDFSVAEFMVDGSRVFGELAEFRDGQELGGCDRDQADLRQISAWSSQCRTITLDSAAGRKTAPSGHPGGPGWDTDRLPAVPRDCVFRPAVAIPRAL
jgi:hypothetical protein